MQRTNLTPLPMLKWSVPVQEPLNNENLQNKAALEQGCLKSVTYYKKEYGINSSYTVVNKNRTKTLTIKLVSSS